VTRNSVVFAVCLLLAFVLLFLNKLSTTYFGDLKAHIAYINLPQGKVPVAPLPNELRLEVETNGFRLVWAHLRNPVKVQIDLSGITNDFLPSSKLKSNVASQLSADYKLVEIFPDTLFFRFEKSLTKKVPVAPDIQISFKKQYDFTEPMLLSPDSVELTGPENAVAEIKNWKTQKLVFENLDKSTQDEIPLAEPPDKTITVKPLKVKYTIGVEQFTEKSLEVAIEKTNLPEKNEVSIHPDKVKVIFRVGLSNYESVNEDAFTAVADFADVELGKSKYVAVKIEQSPPFIKNLDYSPKSVEYIIYH